MITPPPSAAVPWRCSMPSIDDGPQELVLAPERPEQVGRAVGLVDHLAPHRPADLGGVGRAARARGRGSSPAAAACPRGRPTRTCRRASRGGGPPPGGCGCRTTPPRRSPVPAPGPRSGRGRRAHRDAGRRRGRAPARRAGAGGARRCSRARPRHDVNAREPGRPHAAAHRALHRRRPPGVGPGAGQEDALERGRGPGPAGAPDRGRRRRWPRAPSPRRRAAPGRRAPAGRGARAPR